MKQAWLAIPPVPAFHSSPSKKITVTVFLCFQEVVIVSLGADLQGNLVRWELLSLVCSVFNCGLKYSDPEMQNTF